MKTKYIILAMIYILFHITGLSIAQENGIVQFYLDPKMMIEGPYKNSKSGELDFLMKIGSSTNTYEMGFFVEKFKAIKYTSAGVYYNKKINVKKLMPSLDKFEFSVGFDSGFIHRIINEDKNYSITAALNAETKYFLKKNFGISLKSNYRYRGDLVEFYGTKNPMLFSGYVGVFLKF
ncbi:hypothetical protein [Wenyingzhuangia sp. IMCC45467]